MIGRLRRWNVCYDKQKNKLMYGSIKDYYCKDKTVPIKCGFRILHTTDSTDSINQNVVLPSEFACYMAKVHKRASGTANRDWEMQKAVEECVGKVDLVDGIYNAQLLDLCGGDVEFFRENHELPDGASVGDLALREEYVYCNVFRSFDPLATKVEIDSSGNTKVHFFDNMGERIRFYYNP
ncbi:hypothetical protein LQW54_008113 [Pestalotiopsis sp. IQ-011]